MWLSIGLYLGNWNLPKVRFCVFTGKATLASFTAWNKNMCSLIPWVLDMIRNQVLPEYEVVPPLLKMYTDTSHGHIPCGVKWPLYLFILFIMYDNIGFGKERPWNHPNFKTEDTGVRYFMNAEEATFAVEKACINNSKAQRVQNCESHFQACFRNLFI